MAVMVPIHTVEVYPVSPGDPNTGYGVKVQFKDFDPKRGWIAPKNRIIRSWNPEQVAYYFPRFKHLKGLALKYALMNAKIDAPKLHLQYRSKREIRMERKEMREMGNTKLTADVRIDKTMKVRDLEKALVEKLGNFTVKVNGNDVIVLTKSPRPSKEPNAEKASIILICDEKIYSKGAKDRVEIESRVREALYNAIEEIPGIEEVLKLEPQNPKDEGN